MAVTSSDVVAGNNILATDYNKLRDDIINTTSGHFHDGSDSRFVLFEDIDGVQSIRKASNEDVNNSITLQNDNHFTFAVAANEVWMVEIHGTCISNTVSEIKFSWSLPSGGTFVHIIQMNSGSAQFEAEGTGVLTPSTGANDISFHIWAMLKISSTAGTATLQWAQRTAEVFNTRIEVDSWLRAMRED